MRFRLENIPKLALPLSVAVLVAVVLMNELDFSRLWAVPIGLWCALQVQNSMNRVPAQQRQQPPPQAGS